jgi:hypothetical protein
MSARTAQFCRACPTSRRSKADIVAIKETIQTILRTDRPATVRQIFYQLVARGVIEKTEKEYNGTVIRLLTAMRLNGEISFAWIIDETRIARETETFNDVVDAVSATAKFYRRSALKQCADYVEVWCEKEALAGLIWDVAGDYDVPVVTTKGMPSLTQIYLSALNIARAAEASKESFIYQFGDHDPSGVLIPEIIERRLNELCQKFDCPVPYVERIALTETQIQKYKLPTRPTKRVGNMHARKFVGRSVELDALPSNVLRELVCNVIERHISAGTLETLRAAEQSERQLLNQWVSKLKNQDTVP